MFRVLVRHPLVLFCSAACFGIGLAFPAVPLAQGVPERVVPPPHRASDSELSAWRDYHRALTELKARYVGELPPDLRLTYAAVRGLLEPLDDPFTRFMEPVEFEQQLRENTGEFVGIGVYLDDEQSKKGYFVIERTVRDGPAARAGLLPQDRVLAVDGKPVKGKTREQVSTWVRGESGTTVRLTVQRPGEPRPREVRVVRAPVELEVVEHEMKPGQIGYVRLMLFSGHADEQLVRAVRELQKQGMRALVLDLRGNPGGVLPAAEAVVSRFVPPGHPAVICIESGGRRSEEPCDPKRYLQLGVPLVVLIDRDSASAAEIVAGAIKDHKIGLLVGETTFGKGLVQTVIPLPGRAAVAITSAKYLTSKGSDINRTRTRRGGVMPDVPVPMTDRDLFEGRDPQLSRALEYLRERLASAPGASS